jgi:cell division protein FtsL
VDGEADVTTDPFLLMSIGAGLVVVLVVLVAVSVAVIVHAHEVRELRIDSERHAEIRRDLDDLRRLTLNAINGRAALAQDVDALKIKVKDLDTRVLELEGL